MFSSHRPPPFPVKSHKTTEITIFFSTSRRVSRRLPIRSSQIGQATWLIAAEMPSYLSKAIAAKSKGEKHQTFNTPADHEEAGVGGWRRGGAGGGGRLSIRPRSFRWIIQDSSERTRTLSAITLHSSLLSVSRHYVMAFIFSSPIMTWGGIAKIYTLSPPL